MILLVYYLIHLIFWAGIIGMLFSAFYVLFHKTERYNHDVALLSVCSIFIECDLGWQLSGIANQPNSWLPYFAVGAVAGSICYLLINHDKPRERKRK